MSEEEALSAFLNYIENAVLVAHHAAFDLSMINGALKRMNLPRLKNKIVDTGHLYTQFKRNAHTKHFSLDDLSKEMNIPQHDRHTASGDAYITALLFLKLIAKMSLHKKLSFNDLLMQKPKIGLL
jgi:DNA polymerase-3 subunit epsilon